MHLKNVAALAASLLVLALAAPPADAAASRADRAAGAKAAAKLREEWDLGTNRMMLLVVEECKWTTKLKRSVRTTVQGFIDKQEELLGRVERDPSFEKKARLRRAEANAEFLKSMEVVYKDPKLKREFERRMAAMEKELDEMAKGSDALMAKLAAAGATPQQRAAIKATADEGSRKVKSEASKSPTGSARDPKTREEAVKALAETKRKVREQLTEEQKAKLDEKAAE